MTDADCHPGRAAALVAALGAERLWVLVAQFRDDLAGLAAEAGGLDAAALRRRLHRLHGAAGTLGFDATAAALAAVMGEAAAADAGLAAARAALARGEQALAQFVPVPPRDHAGDASKR